MSAYGYDKRTTPHLDRFAEDNLFFRNAFAPGTWTIPTHFSMLTGLYVTQHRVENARASRRLNEDLVTLPEMLQRGGYRTVAFSQNELFSPRHHFDQFQEYYDLARVRKDTPVTGAGGSFGNMLRRYWKKVRAPRELLDAAAGWITRHGDQPLFCTINVTNVHYPWAPPPDLLLRQLGMRAHLVASSDHHTLEPFHYNSRLKTATPQQIESWHRFYDAAAMHIDREFGRFLRQLQAWQGWDNTILVVTSDHGEMLGEYHGIVGHTLCLHDNIIHVPLLVRHPDYRQALVVHGVVQTLDLFSTFAEWAEVATEGIPEAQFRRPSLDRALSSPSLSAGYAFAEEDYTVSHPVRADMIKANPLLPVSLYPNCQVVVRSATRKYLWRDDRRHEFYDLEVDPREERNVLDAGEEPAELAHLRQVLQEWRASLELFPPVVLDQDVTTDPATRARLRALGYLA